MQKENRNIKTEFLDELDRHQGILQKICFVYSKKSLEKEDLCQEIILQLWKSYPSFKRESAFSTWMYRVALNTALSLTKKKQLFIRSEEIHESSFDMEYSMNLTEDIKVLYKAISQLNKVEKAIILLWLEDKSYKEIADIIGMSIKNISVRLVRIKAKLKDLINKYQ
ncbi:sigma-70 family RNA polymerase sigma factor [Gaetbulibacter aquiaggeris]|uniref:Sigma-70 family RNA polymerase sigma factor n=1 Tax=Gaetbulibacter aquiaggeris TaxID=1735373 RepID=A0ABW7MPA5_9FLAO